jgi:hypothetical protein
MGWDLGISTCTLPTYLLCDFIPQTVPAPHIASYLFTKLAREPVTH